MWILIRQNILPIAIRYQETVVDYDMLYRWIHAHQDVFERLQEVRTSASPHPLVEMFVLKSLNQPNEP